MLFGFLPPAFSASTLQNGVLNYQGRVTVSSILFDGTGQFKFSLVNRDSSQTFWKNSIDPDNDGQPDEAISLPVTKGLYAVTLGDTSVPNMAEIPLAVFTGNLSSVATDPLFLRVWFNDGVHGFERLVPDQRISTSAFSMGAAYAEMAANVPDGSITSAKLATGALASVQAQLDALAAKVASLGGGSAAPGAVLVSSQPSDSALVNLGYVAFTRVSALTWVTGSVDDAPSPRYGHAAADLPTRKQMFVWGGQLGPNSYSAAGALYGFDSDRWLTIPPSESLSGRRGHTVVSTETGKAFVWGGFSNTGFLNSGGSFDPQTMTWSIMALENAPVGRDGHIALWIAPYVVVWGGRNSSGLRGDGALFDSTQGAWASLTLPNGPEARTGATAVRAGDQILIWGGSGIAGALDTGSRLIFSTDPLLPAQWQPMSRVNAPAPRTGHTAILAGTNIVVWGGRSGGTLFNDGAIYNPLTDSWRRLSSNNAPSPRYTHSAVWTGREMVIFGGETAAGPTGTGAAYNPATDQWRTIAENLIPRSGASMIWSGSDLLVFGGQSASAAVGALQRLNPQPTWYFYHRP